MERPPEIPDKGPDYSEVIDKIQEVTNGIDFGPEFITNMLIFFRENARELFSGQTTFFILGSYRDYPLRRLHFAERELNSRPMTYAFVLCDLLDPKELRSRSSGEYTTDQMKLLDDINEYLENEAQEKNEENATDDDSFGYPQSHCQFYLLSTYSNYVIPIFEGRHAGPSIELVEIRNHFFDKAHIFSRSYDFDIEKASSGNEICHDVDPENPYSQPQKDIFALFEHEGRHTVWRLRSDLASEIQKLPNN